MWAERVMEERQHAALGASIAAIMGRATTAAAITLGRTAAAE
jgi:hypothetical protein